MIIRKKLFVYLSMFILQTIKNHVMATNPPKNGARKGAVKNRSQFQNPVTKLFSKRNTENGQIMDNSKNKFKGVRKEK